MKNRGKSAFTSAALSMLLSGEGLTSLEMSIIGAEKYGVNKGAPQYSSILTKIYGSDLGFFITRAKNDDKGAYKYTLHPDACRMTLDEAYSLYDARGEITLQNITQKVKAIKKVDLSKDPRPMGKRHSYTMPTEQAEIPELPVSKTAKDLRSLHSPEELQGSPAWYRSTLEEMQKNQRELEAQISELRQSILNSPIENKTVPSCEASTKTLADAINKLADLLGEGQINVNLNLTHRIVFGKDVTND